MASALTRVVPPVVVPHPSLTNAVPAASARYPAESLGRVVTGRDLFRTDRRPAQLAYDPLRGAGPLPEGPPKPTLNLTGMVWGALPEAVIEGLPTTDGPRVVRVGDVVGGLAIRRIGRRGVVVAGMDTTWTLVVKEPWK
ncbi:MAG TPA: hypothetical protein VH113_07275 [Gemmatimonadales bacterium]|nr:hypothetical protein [Gemmatimonadales bacterium]